MMARFRQDYLDLLHGRVATIGRLIAEHQLEAAEVALLSLESSSSMVGASELASAVRGLRAALETVPPDELDALAAQLAVTADEAALRLSEGSD